MSQQTGYQVAVERAAAYLRDLAAREARPVGEVVAGVLTALDPDAGWSHLMQQVLDGLPGQHSALLPVRDPTGTVVDLVFAAISPAVVDLSGRHLGEIVGHRVAELYPSLVGGPVWRSWYETLADGQPREVGPVAYLGSSEWAPAGMSLTVRVRAAGPGLLCSWVRHDEQDRLAERIAQTERLGNLGWGETDLVTGATVWSDELYRIYERDPTLGPLDRDGQNGLILPEDRPLLDEAARSYARGGTVDVTYRIRVGGRTKHIRVVAEPVRDAQGRPVKLYGIVQDVTAPVTSRAKLAEVEQQLVEHQRSLEAEHQLAAQLQQIVLPLPTAPIDLAGLRVAVRYLPAERAHRVGGDWYHAAVADDGSVLLAVGDVTGHGIAAAATMAQLRHALATLIVTTTTDPAQLLGHLNRLLCAGGTAVTTATAVIGRYEPGTRTLTWSQAGHPAPLRTRAGRTEELPRPAGLLLGAARDARYGTASVAVDPGDLLLFYTDGLVERRDRPIEEELDRVRGILDRISRAGGPQPLADLLAELPPANPNDDTCVLAVRRRPDDPPVELVREVTAHTLAGVRQDARAWAGTRGLSGESLEGFVLAVNELMSNAVIHGGGSGRLELWQRDGQLYSRVSDRGPGLADATRPVTLPPPDVAGGRGLWLARAASADMAITTGPEGTAVTLTHEVDSVG